MSARKPFSTNRVIQDIQAPNDAITQLASLGETAKFKIQLEYKPVAPGTFSISGIGVRGYADGRIFDETGEYCGSIDYNKGEVLISVGTLRKKRDWKMRYDYAPGGSVCA